MFLQEIKAIAAQYGLTRSGVLAYGNVSGCRITLKQHLLYASLNLYLGAVDAVPEGSGQTSQVEAMAQAIAQDVMACTGEGNMYNLYRANPVEVEQGGSIVSIRFAVGKGMQDAINRFFNEVLFRYAQSTAPFQCIHCGGLTNGQGVPVRISPSFVVPMHAECHQQCMAHYQEMHDPQIPFSQLKLPLIYTVASAVLGIVLWLLLYSTIWAGIPLTLATIALVFGAYTLMKGPQGKWQHMLVGSGSSVAVVLGLLGKWLISWNSRYNSLGQVAGNMMRRGVYLRIQMGSTFTKTPLIFEMLLYLAMVAVALYVVHQVQKRRKGGMIHRPVKMQGQA